MCAIFGSFDIEKLRELKDLNAYRGEISGSLTLFMQDIVTTIKIFGEITPEHFKTLHNLNFIEGDYFYLGHIQAPTTEAAADESVHPAIYHNGYDKLTSLWHNGIIKQRELDRINKENNSHYVWDTQMLCESITNNGFESLSDIEGSFACVYVESDIDSRRATCYIFRNEISPLFVDDQLNISSTKFEGSHSLEPGKVFKLDIVNRKLIDTNIRFKTKENPYFF